MAIYPTDAIGNYASSTFTSMADRKPDRGYGLTTEYSTLIFESESGYEKRRLRSRRPKRSYDLTYTNITGVERSAIESFFRARSGSFETFTLDLTHVNETGTVTVRFEGNLKVDHVLSSGSLPSQNYYNISFNLKETYE
jgi:hypothetical protein